MAGWWTRWLGGANGDEPRELQHGDERCDYVTDRGRIVKLLEDLCRRHVLLGVRIPEIEQVFISSLLGVGKEGGVFILDELNPVHGNDIAAAAARFEVEAMLGGVMLSFDVSRFRAEKKDGVALYRAPLPKEIYYPQRRADYRAPTSVNIPITGQIERLDARLQGALANLSNGGLALHTRQEPPPRVGDILRRCILTLPEGESVHADLEVCYVANSRGNRRVLVGCRFLDMEKHEQKRIAQFLFSLQREKLRKQLDEAGE